MAILDMPLVGTLNIADSGTTSQALKIPADVALVGLILPTLTSCDFTLEVSHDATAANFKPLYKADGNEWKITGTTGGFAIPVEALMPYEYVRAKCSAAQSGAKAIYIIGRK